MVKNGRGPLLAPTMVLANNKQLHRFSRAKISVNLACEAQNLEIRIFAQNSHSKKWAWPIPTTSDTDRLVDFFGK